MRLGIAFTAAMLLASALAVATPSARQTAAGEPAQPGRPSFGDWLAAFRADALDHGISSDLLDRALSGLEPLERVLESDRQQAELVLPFERYLERTLTPGTIEQAREARAANAELLSRIDAAYGVPPGIVVSIWGLESRFGRNTGRTPTLQALATLAWDGRRAAFFREELLNVLRIVDRDAVELDRLKGSWAGAMGQPQFMPSSYLAYAEDFDGDGRRDIWTSTADVFASVANYLAKNGWKAGLEWGREVAVTKNQLRRIRRQVPYRSSGCYAVRGTTEARPVAEWRRFGVRRRNSQPLPSSAGPPSLVTDGTRSFLVTSNYFALLRYNCAHHYALTAALLSAASDQPPTAVRRHAATPRRAPARVHRRPRRRR